MGESAAKTTREKSLFKRYMEWGHLPLDTEKERLRKSSLLLMASPFAVAGLLWGGIYFANGLILSGSIPFNYGILSIVSIFYFRKTGKYGFFRNSQLLLILILPFALQVSLGGFIPGSAVVLWAIIAPAGALIFHDVQKALIWFAAYVILIVIAYLINDSLKAFIHWELTENFINALLLMNVLGVTSLVFLIQHYFVRKQQELQEAIRQKNATLADQSAKLKELDKTKSRFFANISHEFRTPLTLILGLIRKQQAAPHEPPNSRDNDAMLRNANRLLQLINQLLDLSKLESGELKLEVRQQDLTQFTQVLCAQFESLAQSKNIAFRLNGHPLQSLTDQPPIPLAFDKDKLQKILTNLISNAFKFSAENGKVEVTLSPDPAKKQVKISVMNTGPTIPKDKQSLIFDRFYQVDDASRREYEGTGIGLALVKELVELHQGSVDVVSEYGETCFSIYLPMNLEQGGGYNIAGSDKKTVPAYPDREESHMIPIPSFPSTSQEEIRTPTLTPSSQLELLIVEDNPDLRAFIRDILEKEYEISEAVDGMEGFDKAVSAIPDLIISDVMMPRMDGYELCHKLKSDERTDHIPLILLTAKAARENKLEGLETGADDYLVKPFDEEELRIRIKNLISSREKLQKKYQQEILLQPKQIRITSVQQRFLNKIKEIIEQQLDNSQFGVEDLEREIGMSRSQIHRKLKALTDQSVTTFIRNYRLYRAADLLKQQAGNITEIAYQVGFGSQSYFSSSFQELFGCSPTEYLKQ